MKLRIETTSIVHYQEIKPGTNPAKCIALMKAAYSGNLEEVKSLILDLEVDANFWGCVETEVIGQWEYHTALSLAACSNHIEIVRFLLQQGAKVETQDKHYGSASHFKQIISLNHYSYPLDLDIIKLLIRKQTYLYESQVQEYLKSNLTHDIAILHFFLHEAVIRSKPFIFKMIRDRRFLRLTAASFLDYIKDFSLSSDEILNSYECIKSLYAERVITDADYNQLCQFFVKEFKTRPLPMTSPDKEEQAPNIRELQSLNMLLQQKVADLESRIATMENQLKQQSHYLAQLLATHSEQSPPTKQRLFS